MQYRTVVFKNTFYPLIQWAFLATLVAVLTGSCSAFFLFCLDWATTTRLSHPWLLCLLPAAGFAVGWVYLRFGSAVEAGNNLILEEIHHPSQVIKLIMAPLVFTGTVISHLFGASVGREGTAVQMGASIADQFTRLFGLTDASRRIILMTGISAGFSSVFGTPLAGAIFGLEMLSVGRMNYSAIFPCVVAAVIADQTGLMWGVHHTHYVMTQIPAIALWPLAGVLIAGCLFGLAARVFAETTSMLSRFFKKQIQYAPLRPFAGGIIIICAVYLLHTDRFIGLGIPVIVDAFRQPLSSWDFVGKLAFTAVSLGAGFKGGEVTPLFYVGATLGNALAPVLHFPFSFLAGMGFVAVFAGAANTPIASTLMAIELFGVETGIYAALACSVAYLISGHTGIYKSQRVACPKYGAIPEGTRLADIPLLQKTANIQDEKITMQNNNKESV